MNSKTLGLSAAMLGLSAMVNLTLGSGPARADDFFAACSNNVSQKMHKLQVNSVPACKPTETLRMWNQTGPQGPQGDPGFTNCSTETFPGTCQANTFAVLNVSCSTGFATGASAIWTTPFGAANNGKFYLYARNGNLWTVIPYNDTGSVQNFEVQLQCCD
jgi:hypothetical protein